MSKKVNASVLDLSTGYFDLLISILRKLHLKQTIEKVEQCSDLQLALNSEANFYADDLDQEELYFKDYLGMWRRHF